MANNASAEKCIRQSERHRLHNRYYAKTWPSGLCSLTGSAWDCKKSPKAKQKRIKESFFISEDFSIERN